MKRKQFEITEDISNKIISAAYKDAGWLDRIIVWRMTLKHKEAKNLFDSYRATASEVRKIKEDECPEELVLNLERKTKSSSGFLGDFYSVVFVRPAISLVVFAVVVSAIIFGVIRNKTVEYEFTEAEVIEADKQAQQAFAIVGDIFKQTKTTLENDVLGDKVAKPLNKGFGIINIILEGEKNEIN